METFPEAVSASRRRFRIRRRFCGTTRTSASYSYSLDSITVLLLLFTFAIGSVSSFGANENDPEGSIVLDGDGQYRYYAAAATTRSVTDPQMPENLVVGYEPDYYAPGGAYWGATNNNDVGDRGNTNNNAKNNHAFPPNETEAQVDGMGSSLSITSTPENNEAREDGTEPSLPSSSLPSSTPLVDNTPNANPTLAERKEFKSPKSDKAYKMGLASRGEHVHGGAAGRNYSNRRLRGRVQLQKR